MFTEEGNALDMFVRQEVLHTETWNWNWDSTEMKHINAAVNVV